MDFDVIPLRTFLEHMVSHQDCWLTCYHVLTLQHVSTMISCLLHTGSSDRENIEHQLNLCYESIAQCEGSSTVTQPALIYHPSSTSCHVIRGISYALSNQPKDFATMPASTEHYVSSIPSGPVHQNAIQCYQLFTCSFVLRGFRLSRAECPPTSSSILNISHRGL